MPSQRHCAIERVNVHLIHHPARVVVSYITEQKI